MKILFVCTGNTCRSPLAEVLAQKAGFEARSRGLAAYESAEASKFAITAAAERGCDLTAHEAHSVQESDMSWADTVYGLTMAHVRMLRTVFPTHADKIKPMPGGDVPDPLGGTISDYRACADKIEQDIAEIC